MKYLIAFLAMMPLIGNSASVNLSWDASPDPGIGEYRVYYGTVSQTYADSVSAGMNLFVTVSNLLNSTAYYFVVTAKNTNGLESEFSGEISVTTDSGNKPPLISVIADQVVTLPMLIQFSVYDPDSSNLTMVAASSNEQLVPPQNLVISSSGTNASMLISPLYGKSGEAIITLIVSDGVLNTTATFHLSVVVPGAPANIRMQDKPSAAPVFIPLRPSQFSPVNRVIINTKKK